MLITIIQKQKELFVRQRTDIVWISLFIFH